MSYRYQLRETQKYYDIHYSDICILLANELTSDASNPIGFGVQKPNNQDSLCYSHIVGDQKNTEDGVKPSTSPDASITFEDRGEMYPEGHRSVSIGCFRSSAHIPILPECDANLNGTSDVTTKDESGLKPRSIKTETHKFRRLRLKQLGTLL